MPEYSAAQIVGKGLTAAKTVNIYRTASDTAKVEFIAKAGTPLGIVYSYLMPSTYRKHMYWMFYDQNRRPYYVRHETGAFTVDSTAKTTKQQQREADSSGNVITDTATGIQDSFDDLTEGLSETANKILKGGLIFGGVILGLKFFDKMNGTRYADFSDFRRDYYRYKKGEYSK